MRGMPIVVLSAAAMMAAAQPNATERKVNGLLRRAVTGSAAWLTGPSNDRTSNIQLAEARPAPPEAGPADVFASSLPPVRIRIRTLAGEAGALVESLKSKAGAPPAMRLFSAPADLRTLPRIISDPAVQSVEIERPVTPGRPVVFRPFNAEARRSHLVDEYAATYKADGRGVTLALVDEGPARVTHVEFRREAANPQSSRIESRSTLGVSLHATHVAGTLAAEGAKAEAKGMAPAAQVLSFDWDRDLEKLEEASGSASVSNHSYGPVVGWYLDPFTRNWFWYGEAELSAAEDARFGRYASDAAALDEVLSRKPEMVSFAAAGNDRGEGPAQQPVQHYELAGTPGDLRWRPSMERRPGDGEAGQGYDSIAGLCLAKNAICIGAVEDIAGASGIMSTDFSGWGPADDGRIKPDLVANGRRLLSTASADDRAYLELSGTSMASPVAAGIGAALVQQFRRDRGRNPLSAEIKAVLIHSASDAGTPGPDAVFGWGVINALQAGHVVALATEHLVETAEVAAFQTTEMVLARGEGPIRVTVVWTDPAGPLNMGGNDDATPALVNDLDATLVAPDGVLYYPYSLSAGSPAAPASQAGPNRVDNVEVIDAPALSGVWRLRVKAGALQGSARQRFALVTSGLRRP